MKIIKYFFEFIIVITLFIFFKLIGKKMHLILDAIWLDYLDHCLDQPKK